MIEFGKKGIIYEEKVFIIKRRVVIEKKYGKYLEK
jgi:hypothetical protein